jgi:hypothetical protein
LKPLSHQLMAQRFLHFRLLTSENHNDQAQVSQALRCAAERRTPHHSGMEYLLSGRRIRCDLRIHISGRAITCDAALRNERSTTASVDG